MDTLIIVIVIIICTYLIIRAAKKQNPKIANISFLNNIKATIAIKSANKNPQIKN